MGKSFKTTFVITGLIAVLVGAVIAIALIFNFASSEELRTALIRALLALGVFAIASIAVSLILSFTEKSN